MPLAASFMAMIGNPPTNPYLSILWFRFTANNPFGRAFFLPELPSLPFFSQTAFNSQTTFVLIYRRSLALSSKKSFYYKLSKELIRVDFFI